jgi:hypothetical protein
MAGRWLFVTQATGVSKEPTAIATMLAQVAAVMNMAVTQRRQSR